MSVSEQSSETDILSNTDTSQLRRVKLYQLNENGMYSRVLLTVLYCMLTDIDVRDI